MHGFNSLSLLTKTQVPVAILTILSTIPIRLLMRYCRPQEGYYSLLFHRMSRPSHSSPPAVMTRINKRWSTGYSDDATWNVDDRDPSTPPILLHNDYDRHNNKRLDQGNICNIAHSSTRNIIVHWWTKWNTSNEIMKKKKLARCPRPRLSELPFIITALVAIPLLVLAWQTGMDLEVALDATSDGMVLDTLFQKNATLQPVSCVQIIENSQRNSTDANRNRLFLRLVDEEPRFWISLHVKGYDKVRWGVMEHGRYYEQIEVRIK